MRDEKSCASGPEAQREAEKATKESKIIDLTEDDGVLYYYDADSDVVIVVDEDIHRKPPSSSATAGPSSSVNPQRRSDSSGKFSSITNKLNPFSKTPIRNRPEAQLVEWSCQACTLLNPYISLQCEACETHRPF